MVFKSRMMEHKSEQHKSKGMRPRKGVKDGTLRCVGSLPDNAGPEVKFLFCLWQHWHQGKGIWGRATGRTEVWPWHQLSVGPQGDRLTPPCARFLVCKVMRLISLPWHQIWWRLLFHQMEPNNIFPSKNKWIFQCTDGSQVKQFWKPYSLRPIGITFIFPSVWLELEKKKMETATFGTNDLTFLWQGLFMPSMMGPSGLDTHFQTFLSFTGPRSLSLFSQCPLWNSSDELRSHTKAEVPRYVTHKLPLYCLLSLYSLYNSLCNVFYSTVIQFLLPTWASLETMHLMYYVCLLLIHLKT